MNKRLLGLLALLGVVIIGAGIYLYSTGTFGPSGDKPAQTPAATSQEASQKRPPAGKVEQRGPAETGGQDKGGAGFVKYAAQERRDPFVPLVAKAEGERKKGVTPLEEYETSEFKVVAILWSKSGYYAVVTMPNGKSYTVREGMRIGLHDGKVQKITKDSVVVREVVRNERGVRSQRDTVLKLRVEDQA